VEQLLPVILKRLEDTFLLQIVSNDDRENQIELQGLLCGTMQVITQKLGAAAVPFADRMMHTFLQVFGAKNSTVQEEVLMAVGAVATATEAGFEKYMPHFRPFLGLGLANYEEHQVCAVAIGVVGDICRALEAKVLPYCDEIVNLLLRNLQNPALNRNVKPPILSCFGDIALAVGGHFEKYMQVTMSMLVQASSTAIDTGNADLVEYLNQLREGIFEAYTGVLQGLRADDKSGAFEPYVMGALDLIRQVAEGIPSGTTSDEVLRAAAGVVGDLGSSLGARGLKAVARQSPHREYLKALLKEAKASSNEQTKQVGQWAHGTLFAPP
jgi:importin subunit beta-1